MGGLPDQGIGKALAGCAAVARYFGVFGWHISGLKIYDEPRKLNAFYKKCSEYTELSTNCFDCEYECGTDEVECDSEGRLYLHRAPKSWCYVEETDNDKT